VPWTNVVSVSALTGLVALSSEGQKTLITQTDRSVGGRFFDDRLARHLMEVFNTQHRSKGVRLTPETHPKVFAKLLSVAERVKRQMSANRNNLPVIVECLSNDLDLNAEIGRQQFEHLCQDLFERVRNCFVRLIQRSRLERGRLHSVEIFGGSSRFRSYKTFFSPSLKAGVNVIKLTDFRNKLEYL
jgi:molecular chaperone DnaK